jgi:hypothetical protein
VDVFAWESVGWEESYEVEVRGVGRGGRRKCVGADGEAGWCGYGVQDVVQGGVGEFADLETAFGVVVVEDVGAGDGEGFEYWGLVRR